MPRHDYLHGLDRRVADDGKWTLKSGETVQRFSARTVTFSEQTIDTTLWYDVVGREVMYAGDLSRFPLRYVTRSELELMLELAGVRRMAGLRIVRSRPVHR